jgi:hypothetical protein
MDQNGPVSNDYRSPAFGHLGYRVVELRFETQAGDRLVRTPSYNWEVLI